MVIRRGIESMNTMRLMILDRDRIFGEGLGICLAAEEHFEFCGTAHDWAEAQALIEREQPNLIILDRTYLINGSALTIDQLKRHLPAARVILLTQAAAGQALNQHAGEALADGVVSRLLGVDAPLAAIKEIVQGAAPCLELDRNPVAAQGAFIEDSKRGRIPSLDELDKLSPREREVLSYVANGYTSKEIAKSLDIKQRTVEVHRHHLLKKLSVRGVADLVKFAIRSGLTKV